jgi:HlyD family secretion protein
MPKEQAGSIPQGDYAELDKFASREFEQSQRSEIIAGMPSIVQRGAIYLIAGALLVTLAMLYFGKVHVVVSAKGRIVPEGDLVNLQPIQGGQVHAILARLGDHVSVGEPIIKLDIAESGADLTDLNRKLELQRSQLDLLQSTSTEVERILRDTGSGSTATSKPVVGNAGPLLSNLETARVKLESAQAEFARRSQQKKLESDEIQSTIDHIAANERIRREQKDLLEGEEQALKAKKQQLDAFRGLAEKKILSPLELGEEEEKYRQAENALSAARQQYEQRDIDLSNQKLHLSDLQARQAAAQMSAENNVRLAQLNFQQAVAALRQESLNLAGQIDEAAANLESLEAKVKMAESRVSLMTISAPVSGTLSELAVNHSGEIIGAGAIVASIAPDNVPLTIMAEVPNKDVGFLRPGLAARIKVDAYPFEQFGTAAGEVAQVLPNAGKDANFLIRIKLNRPVLDEGGANLRLFPGLTVTAEVMTARQRLINLLFSKDSRAQGSADQ